MDEPTSTPNKVFKLGSRNKSASAASAEDFNEHVAEIKKEWERKRSDKHLRFLLKQTRGNRLEKQNSLKPGKFSPIMERFPCCEEGSFVSTCIVIYM